MELGAGGVEVALTRGQTMEGSHPDDLPSRVGEGRVEVGDVGSGGGRSDSAKWKKGSGKWARVRVMRAVREETT